MVKWNIDQRERSKHHPGVRGQKLEVDPRSTWDLKPRLKTKGFTNYKIGDHILEKQAGTTVSKDSVG